MKKVLIVEDHPDQLLRMITILRQYADRFVTVPAKNGREAISVLKGQEISLVVTDIQMPDIDGIMLLAYINTYHPEIPCFVTTAYGTSRLRAKLPRDILRFFHKPFDVHDLAKAIITALAEGPADKSESGISLVKLMHLVTMEKATCKFEIDLPGRPTSALFFENGVLLDAESGELAGEAAALEILSRLKGQYRIKSTGKMEIPRRIKTDIGELIRNIYGNVDGQEDEDATASGKAGTC